MRQQPEASRKFPTALSTAVILGAAILSVNSVPGYAAGTGTVRQDVKSTSTANGVVTDKAGETLPGVSVRIVGKNVFTVTDVDGNFSIKANKGDKIEFSFIGHNPVIVDYKGKSPLSIIMEEDLKALDEVVVVGYGTQKKLSSTAAVSSMKTDTIAQKPVTNITNSMAGRVAGIIAKQGSGEPGSDGASLRIRGVATLGDQSPLVVVDGVPRDFSKLDPK